MHIESEPTQHLQHAAAAARAASHVLARTPNAQRNAALRAMADALRSQSNEILAANAADLGAALAPLLAPPLAPRHSATGLH